jgi:hypothetical protein
MTANTYPERLDAFIRYNKLSRSAFAVKIGTSERNVANSLTGKKSQMDFLIKISAACPNLNLNWLLTGQGEMLLGQVQKNSGTVVKEPEQEYNSSATASKWSADLNKCQERLDKSQMELKFLKSQLEDKEEIIKLLKQKRT